jgi:hypothetical protein
MTDYEPVIGLEIAEGFAFGRQNVAARHSCQGGVAV